MSRDFARARARWATSHARTLDEAFGVERAKGWRQHDARTWGKAGAVYLEAKRLHEKEGMPIDERCSSGGDEYNLGKTDAGELYHAVNRQLNSRTSE